MNMKKSAIALAVTGAVAAPMSASAAEAYGSINTTLESTSTDNGGVGVIFNTASDDGSLSMSDTWESRLGFSGSEDLGGGLEASYNYEFGLSTSSVGNGSVNEDSNVQTRLAWLALGGDWGEIKAGTQWGVLYEYAGWNHYRTDGHGGATHYYMTSPFGGAFATSDDPSALRQDNTITYTYGGGGYSSDPFTFSVQLRSIDQTTSTVQDDEAIDNVTLGAQGTVGPVTINGTYYQENNTTGAEPTLITLGARANFGPAYVGGTFFQGDTDTTNSREPSAINVLGGFDFGGGTSGYLGVGAGDADASNSDAGDMSTFFLQVEQAFSDRTKVYSEFESVTIDGGSGSDPEQTTWVVGLKHSF